MSISGTKKYKQGIALLLALLILAVVTSASLGISLVLTKQISQTTDFAQGVRAFYAADSGAEQVLYELRKAGKAVSGLTSSRDLDNNTKWQATGEQGLGDFVLSLARDEVFELSLFDPSDQFNHINVDNLNFSQLKSPLEITVIAWNINDPRVNGLEKILVEAADYNLDLTNLNFNGNPIKNINHSSRNYRVRLRPIDKPSAWRIVSAPDSIPNLIRLKTVGISPKAVPTRHAEQALEIVFSTVGVVPSIYDFVLYSEGDIIK